jgi:hypothetical protein
MATISMAMAKTKPRFQLTEYRRIRAATFRMTAYRQTAMTSGGMIEMSVATDSPNENEIRYAF